MAKRRGFFKRSVRRIGRSARRYARSTDSNPLSLVVPAAAYGAARGYLSAAAAPLTSKIPLGQYADEALFGVGGYLMAKKGKGIVKQVGRAMLIVEAASVGAQVVGNMSGGGNSTNSGYSW